MAAMDANGGTALSSVKNFVRLHGSIPDRLNLVGPSDIEIATVVGFMCFPHEWTNADVLKVCPLLRV
jgi:hypothetical protein